MRDGLFLGDSLTGDALALLREDFGFSSDLVSISVLDFRPLPLLVVSFGDSSPFLPMVSDSISTLSSDNSIGSSSSLDSFLERLPLRPRPPLGLSFDLDPFAGDLATFVFPLGLSFSSDSESSNSSLLSKFSSNFGAVAVSSSPSLSL